MRPVLMNPNPGYTIPINMTTRKKAIMDGLKAYGIPLEAGNGTTTGTYNTQLVLNLLYQLTGANGGDPDWANLAPPGPVLVPTLILYFSTNTAMKYGNARGTLIDNYGEYCSYCGMPVQDSSLAVEHCLPKQVFPSVMLNYDNFFLSCPNCNSNKGAKPTWTDSFNWASFYNGTPTSVQDVMDGGMDRQMWPDSGETAWEGLPVVYWNVTSNSRLSNNSALDLGNQLAGVSQNIVYARIIGFAQPQAVAALIGTYGYNDPKVQATEDNFIAIVNLNQFEANNYSDRRVTNRTIVWLNCITSLRNLSKFTVGSEGWNLMLGQIFQTAKNAGFFEIWSWIFYTLYGPTTPVPIYNIFRTVSCDPTQPLYYFPGTDINDLPTQ
ncbi:HNH endonuclease [Chitinophaga jiangningensis]|uniref:HNH endonuclease n=1 Tax=Chitinophaga jiangningensis TaxID=1419482 RepID=A0A1M7LQJ3_9BACT|nr:HNH endonuclease [Chitinophaga jiangningensis]SHM80383.1 HNH endonuclease [Chitinophaga jiangningensis]